MEFASNGRSTHERMLCSLQIVSCENAMKRHGNVTETCEAQVLNSRLSDAFQVHDLKLTVFGDGTFTTQGMQQTEQYVEQGE